MAQCKISPNRLHWIDVWLLHFRTTKCAHILVFNSVKFHLTTSLLFLRMARMVLLWRKSLHLGSTRRSLFSTHYRPLFCHLIPPWLHDHISAYRRVANMRNQGIAVSLWEADAKVTTVKVRIRTTDMDPSLYPNQPILVMIYVRHQSCHLLY